MGVCPRCGSSEVLVTSVGHLETIECRRCGALSHSTRVTDADMMPLLHEGTVRLTLLADRGSDSAVLARSLRVLLPGLTTRELLAVIKQLRSEGQYDLGELCGSEAAELSSRAVVLGFGIHKE